MSRLHLTRPDELRTDQLALYESITTGPRAQGPQHFALTNDDGSLVGPFNALLVSPTLGSALQQLGAAVRYSTGLTARTREIAILTVATHWNSGFERMAHEAVGRAVGLSDDELAAVRAGAVPALDDPHELACARFVRALVEGDADDALWASTREVLDEPTVFELTTLVGYYAALALQLRVFRVDSP